MSTEYGPVICTSGVLVGVVCGFAVDGLLEKEIRNNEKKNTGYYYLGETTLNNQQIHCASSWSADLAKGCSDCDKYIQYHIPV